jgi:hypothetical protein
MKVKKFYMIDARVTQRKKVNLANAFDPIAERIKNNIIGHLAPAGQRY